MTLEELKIEAKRHGYRLNKITPYEKFIPCKCGCNRRNVYYGFEWETGDYVAYECKKCKAYIKGKNNNDAKRVWNEKMRG